MARTHFLNICIVLLSMVVFSSCESEDVCNDNNNYDNIKSINTIMMLADTPSGGSRQGCAYYNGLLFVFHDSNDIIEIYDVDEKRLINIVDMTDGGFSHYQYHCNNANFGNKKYDKNDPFPLLYVSMEHLNQHRILVFRIIGSMDNMKFKLVQTIILPEPSQILLYYPNCYIDTEKNSMWVSGYSTNNYHFSPNNHLIYLRFNLPEVNDGDIVELKKTDIQKTNEFYSITATQGGCFYNGRLFQVFGILEPRYLVVFNQEESKIKKMLRLDLADYEPEGLYVKDGAIYYTTQNRLMKINF